MPRPHRSLTRLRSTLVRAIASALLASAVPISLLADTSSRLRTVPAGTCYCCCGDSHATAGCVKMCELPKYASRWWATTCVKPRVHRPANDSNAGPHIRRPDRATYAQMHSSSNP